MFRLKVKKQDEQPFAFEFETWQEVADKMAEFCKPDELKTMLKEKNETNIRFYIKKSK